MDALAAADAFLFEGFRLDCSGLSRRDRSGTFLPVPVGSRALEVLRFLTERAGNLVTRDEIMNSVWPGIVVESSNLPVQIAALRRVLDDGRVEGSCIQTIPGRGYRFVAPVMRVDADAHSATQIIWDDGGRSRRLSIVVLPFASLSDDREQQYFADGITEDLTTDLSRIEGMVVISRNTTFTYKDKPIDVKQVGRELGVHYLLEGSVRRVGPRIRINAQLIETERAAHLWAERFDRGTDDLFELQDEITTRIAVALNLELVAAEVARPRSNAGAIDCILRGRAAHNRGASLEGYAEAIREFERALTLDPGSVEAQSRLAITLVNRVLNFRPLTSGSDIERAKALAAQAVSVSPRSAVTHYAKGQVLRVQGRHQEAIHEYEAVLALDRNWVWAFADIGRCKIFVGPVDEAIPAQQHAIRLSPRDPNLAIWYYRIGQAHLIQSRIDEAIGWLERACAANPAPAFFHAYLASACALKGDSKRAAAELTEVRRLDAPGRLMTIAHYRRGFAFALPEIRPRVEATFFEGLRRAGMPAE